MAKKTKKEDEASDVFRLDRWLWAARFFKTRGLATEAIRGGHVQLSGQRVKPAKGVTIGDRIEIRKSDVTYSVDVLELSAKRASTPVAQALYQETPESVAKREAGAEQRRLQKAMGAQLGTEGRPDKKQRRLLHRFRQSHDDGA